jgi:hypothetical protein
MSSDEPFEHTKVGMDLSQWIVFLVLWGVAAAIFVSFHYALEGGDPTVWGIVKTVFATLRPSTSNMYNDIQLIA